MFRPYAKFLLYPLLRLLADGCAGQGLNYFVIDLVVTMVSWNQVAIPEVSEDNDVK